MKDPKRQISGSQPQNLNHTSDAQEVQAGESEMTYVERAIRTLAKIIGLEPTKINLWKVAFEELSNLRTTLENRSYESEEEIRSVKKEIYQVIGFFSAFQGLLITAAAKSNLLWCNNAGFVLALSAFATAVAVFGIVQKNTVITDLRRGTSSDKRGMKVSHCNMFFLVVVASIQQ
ncbi:hypothetical protein CY35_13G107800 [Sphagnum magellanicum]|nr:hypothetical protein CY35_13G107800 [Sphagnum magellanicum]